jgi:glucans biosynthesis protein
MDEFNPEDIAAMGWKSCGARTRSGAPCKNLAMYPAGRCRLHGGKSLRGLASPRYKHGRYSKDELVKLTRAASARSAAAVAEMVAVLDEPRSELAELLGDLLDLADTADT